MPNIVKIGRTNKNPQERASELATTGVPNEFIVVYYQKFLNCLEAEKNIHDFFENKRVNKHREFFAVSTKEAIDYIQTIENKIGESGSLVNSDTYLYLYLAKVFWNRKYRIGLFYSTDEFYLEDEESARLIKNLNDAYDRHQDHHVKLINSDNLCLYHKDLKNEIENLLVDKIKKNIDVDSYYDLSDEDDDQTIIVASESYQDYPPEVIYEDILNELKKYVIEMKIDAKYKKLKLEKRKNNI